MTDAGGATNKRETEIRHLITQDTRFQIIQNILVVLQSGLDFAAGTLN